MPVERGVFRLGSQAASGVRADVTLPSLGRPVSMDAEPARKEVDTHMASTVVVSARGGRTFT